MKQYFTLLKYAFIPVIAFVSTLATAQLPAYLPANGLVAWYPFNGNANDESGNGNNGVVNGAVPDLNRFGSINSSYAFDGIDDRITVPNSSSLPGNTYTISLWSKVDTTNSFILARYLLNKGCSPSPSYRIYYQDDGFNEEYVTDNWTNSRQYVNGPRFNSDWTFISVTYDGEFMKFYFDGVLYSEVPQSGLLFNSTSDLLIGCGQSTSNCPQLSAFFIGNLDDIGIWNRALSQSEIEALYTSTAPCDATSSSIEATITEGETYDFNGQSLTAAGSYEAVLANAAGCDSLVTLTLVIDNDILCYNTPDGVDGNLGSYPTGWSFKDFIVSAGHILDSVFVSAGRPGYDESAFDFTFSINDGGVLIPIINYEDYSNSLYNRWIPATNYGLTNVVVRIALPTNAGAIWNSVCFATSPYCEPSSATIEASITTGETYNFNGQSLTTAGTYEAVLVNAAGCDSTVTLSLLVNPALTCEISASATSICAGENLTLSLISSDDYNFLNSLPENLRQGLVAYFPFNGSYLDASGNNNIINSYNCQFTDDRNGQTQSSVRTQGNNNSYLEILSSPSLNTNEFTWSIWVKFNSSSVGGSNLNPGILSRTPPGTTCNGATIFENGSRAGAQNLICNPGVENYGTGSDVIIGNNQWHHVVMVVKPGHYSQFFIDGLPQASTFMPVNFTVPFNQNIRVGRPTDLYWKAYQGDLDDISIYNRVLSTTEIQQLFSAKAYTWSTGAETSSINVSPNQSSTYSVTVMTETQTCTDSITISVNPLFTWYADNDGDGFGDGNNTQQACEQPAGYVENSNDCNDTEILAYTGAFDLCDNGIDEDCIGGDTTCIVFGCTDSSAFNFNPLATFNDGSCQALLTCDINVSAASVCEGDSIELSLINQFTSNPATLNGCLFEAPQIVPDFVGSYNNKLYTIRNNSNFIVVVSIDPYNDFEMERVDSLPFSYNNWERPQLIGSSIYFAGGWYSNFVNQENSCQVSNGLIAYDIATGNWSNKAGMPTARGAHCTASDGQYLYVFGGLNCTSFKNQAERYNPNTNTWTSLPNMPRARERGGAVYLNDKIYVMGGNTSYGYSFLNAVDVLDLVTLTWSTVASLPLAQDCERSPIAYNGEVYLRGGRFQNCCGSQKIWKYSPGLDAWTEFCGGQNFPVSLQPFDETLLFIGNPTRFLSNSGVWPWESSNGTINWSNGSISSSNFVSPTETTTYSVTVTQDGQTCTSDVTITVNQPSVAAIEATITEGETYEFNGQSLTTAGTYEAVLVNTAGCDSVVTLALSMEPSVNCSVTASEASICQGQSVELMTGDNPFLKFIGGSGEDQIRGIVKDDNGYVYVYGYTKSPDFPVTQGAFQTSLRGVGDLFLMKLNLRGDIIWSTLLGGDGLEIVNYREKALAIDRAGNVIIGGLSNSTNFPVSSGAFQANYGLNGDCVLAKFSSSGDLLWSTYYGGSQGESINQIAVDSSSNIYVTGYSYSFNFPTSAGAFQSTGSTNPSNNCDMFLVKFNQEGQRMWGTLYGNNNSGCNGGPYEDATFVTFNGDEIIFGGYLTTYNLQVTPSAYQSALQGGCIDGFYSRFSSSGQRLYSTYFGGNGDDMFYSSVKDVEGNNYFGGYTSSSNFPGSSQNGFGLTDAVLTKLGSNGVPLWSKKFGGSQQDEFFSHILSNSYICAVGYTGGVSSIINYGGKDAYLVTADMNGQLVEELTLGGSLNDYGMGVISVPGVKIIAGYTSSSAGWPSEIELRNQFSFGGSDGFVAFIPDETQEILWSTGAATPSITVAPSETTTYSVTVTQGTQTCTSDVTITVNQPSASSIEATITEGETYEFNGQSLTTAGTYEAVLTNAVGCDSLVTMTLSVEASIVCDIEASELTVCEDDQVELSVNTTAENIDAACTSNQLPENLRNGLVAWYPFCGNANDASGNGNNGVVYGAALTTDRFGNSSSAYSFDGFGQNDHIKVLNSASLQLSTTASFSIWYYDIPGNAMDGNGNYSPAFGRYTLFSKEGDGFGTPPGFFAKMIYAGETNNLGFFSTNGCCDAPNPSTFASQYSAQLANTASWKHAVFVVEPTQFKIYINGELRETRNHNSTFAASNNLNLYIGIFGSGSGNPSWYPLNGKIDDFAIYNRAISSAEVSQLYNANAIQLSWSTGETTPTITVAPNETTTYSVTVTQGDQTCTSDVTISVLANETYYPDADGDGFGNYELPLTTCGDIPTGYTLDNTDCNDGDALNYPFASCDDGDPCTIEDVFHSDCSCAGFFADSDADGTCDTQDLCQGSLEPGTPCDDFDPCTINDVIITDCFCIGTLADGDNDGTCDANDLCSGPEAGTACDDNDPCTVNDLVQSDCTCAGTFTDSDQDGTCDANDLCAGAEPGTACDDNNPCTVGDVITADCSCAGTFADADNDGTCDANDLCAGAEPGSACDDNDPCTINDIILADCSCAGTFADADFDGTCDANDLCLGAEPGSECNDGDPCTVDDVISADCSCVGTFADVDNDGTCDASDLCDGPEPGSACDDGDACTTGDVVQSDCSCRGTAVEPQFSSVSANACGPYTWNNNTYTQSGTYEVTLQNATGCDSIAQLVLTVGEPTTSTETATACGSYTWNGATYTQSGAYTFVSTNASGCPNTATLNLIINTLSIAPTGASASQTSVNAGTQVTLTVQGGSLGTGATWKWYKQLCGGTLIGTGTAITVVANVTTTYYVRAEGVCNTTNCANATVNVITVPCGPQAISATQTSVCASTATTLTVTGNAGAGGVWKWYRNGCGSGISIGTGSNVTVIPTATTTYFVRSEGGACGTTACLSITITTNAAPARPTLISGPVNGLCNLQNVVYTTPSVVGATGYVWTVPSGATIVSGQGTHSIVVNFGSTLGINTSCGTTSICVRSVNNCGTSTARCVDVSLATVAPGIISGPTIVCRTQTYTYSIAAVAGATSYTWTVPATWQILSGQGTTSISVSVGTMIGEIRVVANNACATSKFARKSVTITSCTAQGMPVYEEPLDLLLWPNPANDLVHFDAGSDTVEKLEVYDLMGKRLYEGVWVPELNVSEYASGIYFVRITRGEESVVMRMEVVR